MPHSVFLTGATGFVGRYLLYQLCEAEWVDAVYILIRPKKTLTIQDRYQNILNDELIQLTKKNGVDYSKVSLIAGDLMEPKFGISEKDLKTLFSKVSLVVHSAATLNFAATVQDGVKANTHPTWTLYNMCKSDFKLKPAFVFLSTIATNSHHDVIPEKVTSFSAPAKSIYDFVQRIPRERCNEVHDWLIEGRLDAYGFSKGLVEAMIKEDIAESGGVNPVYFIRPGGIISAWGGPLRSWIHTTCFYGTMGYYVYEKKVPFFICDGNKDINMAPVDFVGNLTMAACLEGLEKREKKQYDIQVVNGSKICVKGCTFNAIIDVTKKNYEQLVQAGKDHNGDTVEYKPHAPSAPWFIPSQWIFDILFMICVSFPMALFKLYEGNTKRYSKTKKLTNYLYKFVSVLGPYLTQPLEIENGYLDVLNKKFGDRYPLDATNTIGRDEFLISFLTGVSKYIVPAERGREKAVWNKLNSADKKAGTAPAVETKAEKAI